MYNVYKNFPEIAEVSQMHERSHHPLNKKYFHSFAKFTK